MELGACGALIFRNEAEAALVLCCGQLIGARSWETPGCILEARVLGSLGPQTVHQALVKLPCAVKVVLSGSGYDGINSHIFLEILFLEVFT